MLSSWYTFRHTQSEQIVLVTRHIKWPKTNLEKQAEIHNDFLDYFHFFFFILLLSAAEYVFQLKSLKLLFEIFINELIFPWNVLSEHTNST